MTMLSIPKKIGISIFKNCFRFYLSSHFGVHHLDGFGVGDWFRASMPRGPFSRYLQETLWPDTFPHIRGCPHTRGFRVYVPDRITLRNLELTESLQDGGKENALPEVLHGTRTPYWVRRGSGATGLNSRFFLLRKSVFAKTPSKPRPPMAPPVDSFRCFAGPKSATSSG